MGPADRSTGAAGPDRGGVQAQQSVAALMSAVVQPGSGTENFEAGMGDWQNWGNAQVVAGTGTAGSSALQVGPGAGGAALKVPDLVAGTTYRLTAQVGSPIRPEARDAGRGFTTHRAPASSARARCRTSPTRPSLRSATTCRRRQVPRTRSLGCGRTAPPASPMSMTSHSARPARHSRRRPRPRATCCPRRLRSRDDRLGRLGQHPRRQRQRQLRYVRIERRHRGWRRRPRTWTGSFPARPTGWP